MRDIGKTIQLHLDEMDMTQAQLGELVGASQQTISLIVNNRRIPSLDTLVKICNILKIDISTILEIDSNDNSSYIISDINEKEIIECYRSLNNDEQNIFNAFVAAIQKQKKKS